jgi:GPI-GlcNAc transferase complex PIG-U subunit
VTATTETAPTQTAIWDRPLSDRALVLVVAVVSLPLVWMGWGTDIDVPNVLRVTEVIRSGDYQPSRPPGVPVVELLVAVLEPVGGYVLVNLATAVAAAALVVGIARLVREWGHDNGDLVALAFFVSPITIIASTSLADFVWALAFFVWGALDYRRGRCALAGVMFALAMGSRISTGFVIVAFMAAATWERTPEQRRRLLRTWAVMAPLTILLYVPSWLAYDRSLDFLQNEQGFISLTSNTGRFLYKNYAVAGIALLAVVLVALPALVRALRRWKDDPLLRFGVLTLVVTEALFFQMPWKPAHLLPCLLGLLLWLVCSDRGRDRRFLWVVVGAVALNGLVSFRPLAPDNPSAATAGRWDPSIEWGLLINDIGCRLDVMDVDPDDPDWDAWSCTLKPMRGAVSAEDDETGDTSTE